MILAHDNVLYYAFIGGILPTTRVMNNWSISAYDTARTFARLRPLHREQFDHLAPPPHRLVLQQHAP
jgi:hypothetical protein